MLGFEPSGDGEHDFLLIEKQAANTTWAARQLAAHAGIPPRDVGFAGQKDRHSVSRQWFSVSRSRRDAVDWQTFSEPGLEIVEVARHSRKLRRGAHRANRFTIVVRGVDLERQQIDDRLGRIATAGVPNYFGEQRFGRAAGNLGLARKLFDGRRLGRQQRSMALSAARAFIFNHILQQRVADGSWNRLLAGDSANLEGSGSVFSVTEVDEQLLQRVAELDLHPSGTLWGSGVSACSGSIAALEQAVADRLPGLAQPLERMAQRSQRPLRMVVRELDWRHHDDTLSLEFVLPRGGFATAVLREIVDYRDCAARAAGADRAARMPVVQSP